MGKTLLPPGFRFHPTDIELVKYYLKRKVMGKKLCVDAISEVDIYKHSPWDLPDKSYLRTGDLKWYFFCPVEKKYGKGGRCNRATERGYWKATGKDRQVLYNQVVAGMIKTLVFHKGKAPKGERTDWVMHEYRLLEDGDLAKEGVVQDMYVLCVLFQKDGLGPRNGSQYGAPFREMDWSDDEGNCDVAVLLTSLSTPAFADPVGPSGSVATTSYAPEYLSYAPTTVDPNCSVAATSCAPKSLSYTPTDGSNATTSCAPKYLSYAPSTVDPNCSVAATSCAPESRSCTPTSFDHIDQDGSNATTSCAPKYLSYAPTTVNPNCSVATASCAPESLSYTPTSFDHIDQDGSNATTSCAPMNSLSTLADPIKQVGSVAATENLLSSMPSAYEVFPRASDVPMPDEAFQFLSEDDVQAMLAMFSEDKPCEEMYQGTTNHFDVAIPSPYAPSHDGHINSLVTGSCSVIANLPVSSSSTHIPLPSAAFNVPSTTHGANNGFTSMNAPSSPVQGDDDIESLLAIFTEDDSICNQPFSF